MTDQSSTDFLRWLTPACMAIGWAMAFFIVVKFNAQTMRLAREVQMAAASDGKRWILWEDRQLLLKFLFKPDDLTELGDSDHLVGEKRNLISHRKTAKKVLLLALAYMVTGFVVAILIPVLVGIRQ